MLARRALLALAVAAASCASSAATAAPWQQDVTLTAVDAGYGEYEHVAFGSQLGMSAEWLAVGVSGGYCRLPSGALQFGTVMMYRYDKPTGQYAFTQEICGAWRGSPIAIWNGWMMVAFAMHDTTPGDSIYDGRVQFLRLNAGTQQWVVQQIFDGSTGGQMGSSLAMEGGVAAAGEPAYNQNRGRVRSWRLDSAGNTWIAETPIEAGTPTSPIPPVDEYFGGGVALDIRNCRAGSCLDPLDVLAVTSRSRIWTIERRSSGWGSRSGVAPARGTEYAYGDIDVNESLAVSATVIMASNPHKPCPTDGAISEPRVLQRLAGSIELRHAGFACRGQLGVEPLFQWTSALAVQSKGREFFSAIEDVPAIRIGVAATWEANSNFSIVPTDFVADPDRTSAIFAATGDNAYNPGLTGDAFGRSIAIQPRRMAVGATFFNGITGTKSGYVALYKR